jgi:hypothetical protein
MINLRIVHSLVEKSVSQKEVPSSWILKSTGGLSRMPAPKTGDWVKSYGGWKGFTAEIHRSIGRNLGGGVLSFSRTN